MGLLSNLFGRKEKAQAAEIAPEPKRTESAYLTETVVFGMHQYRTAGEDSSVYFVDENRGIRKMLVDSVGNIQNFPGIVKEDFWVKEVSPNAMKPQIRFRTSFEKREGRWIMLWQIQPDGRYWEDEDGFGAEKDEEVTLYTFVDMDGSFTGPFRIYRLGNRAFSLDRFESSHTHWFDTAMQEIRAGEKQSHWIWYIFPQLAGLGSSAMAEYYAIRDKEEAVAYWNHPVLSRHLIEISRELLKLDAPISHIMGYPDNLKVRSCMTLFYLISKESVFKEVLDKFYEGSLDDYTVKKLSECKRRT